MSGDTPFSKGHLAEVIGLDGYGTVIDDILHGAYHIDKASMDNGISSTILTSFLKALVIPILATTGIPIPEMDLNIFLEQYKKLTNKTREFIV